MDCVCKPKDLFGHGCCCGFHNNLPLKLFFNGRDYVVARNSYHAAHILCEECLDPAGSWHQIEDDQKVEFSMMAPDVEVLTAAEWVTSLGEGYAISID